MWKPRIRLSGFPARLRKRKRNFKHCLETTADSFVKYRKLTLSLRPWEIVSPSGARTHRKPFSHGNNNNQSWYICAKHGGHTPASLQRTSLNRCWTSMLWSIDGCQNKVSANQYHVTTSLAQV